jgi:adenine-specific DNA-methyltransferase
MRYIGSKANLLKEIDKEISEYKSELKIFCDIFSGTGVVAKFFKKDFEIISNDFLFFSYAIQRALIQNNEKKTFLELSNHIGLDPFQYFLEYVPKVEDLKNVPFIMENFSPYKGNERMYLSEQNALKIDFYRQSINEWYANKIITEDDYFYLIACLIDAVPFVSNIAGTYGAFLKHWDKRSLNNIAIKDYDFIFDNKKNNHAYNLNANELIKKIKGDILYIDPPYNGRQYSSNYHLLETIAKYDNPVLKGKTGLRVDETINSNYCKKSMVYDSLNNLIKQANFKIIVLSYSSEGILKKNEIKDILLENCNPKSFVCKEIPYRRYSRKTSNNDEELYEYLFRIEK